LASRLSRLSCSTIHLLKRWRVSIEGRCDLFEERVPEFARIANCELQTASFDCPRDCFLSPEIVWSKPILSANYLSWPPSSQNSELNEIVEGGRTPFLATSVDDMQLGRKKMQQTCMMTILARSPQMP